MTVGLNPDEFVVAYKGAPPVMTYAERERVLRSCRWVTDVIPNDAGADSRPTILRSGANLVAIGSDWARRDYYAQMGFTQDWLDEHNIVLAYVPYYGGVSTTELKNRILRCG